MSSQIDNADLDKCCENKVGGVFGGEEGRPEARRRDKTGQGKEDE